jgi:hypothetical protein
MVMAVRGASCTTNPIWSSRVQISCPHGWQLAGKFTNDRIVFHAVPLRSNFAITFQDMW